MKDKIFKKFVNERWCEQLPDYESRLERALNNGMDEAFYYAWNYQQKRINELEKYLINAQKAIQRICPEPITFPEIRNLIESYDFI